MQLQLPSLPLLQQMRLFQEMASGRAPPKHEEVETIELHTCTYGGLCKRP